MQMDVETAREIMKLSNEAHTDVQDMLRTVVNLGRWALGRKVQITEKKKQLSISLEDYHTVAPLEPLVKK